MATPVTKQLTNSVSNSSLTSVEESRPALGPASEAPGTPPHKQFGSISGDIPELFLELKRQTGEVSDDGVERGGIFDPKRFVSGVPRTPHVSMEIDNDPTHERVSSDHSCIDDFTLYPLDDEDKDDSFGSECKQGYVVILSNDNDKDTPELPSTETPPKAQIQQLHLHKTRHSFELFEMSVGERCDTADDSKTEQQSLHQSNNSLSIFEWGNRRHSAQSSTHVFPANTPRNLIDKLPNIEMPETSQVSNLTSNADTEEWSECELEDSDNVSPRRSAAPSPRMPSPGAPSPRTPNPRNIGFPPLLQSSTSLTDIEVVDENDDSEENAKNTPSDIAKSTVVDGNLSSPNRIQQLSSQDTNAHSVASPIDNP